jgi:uncharacterized protein YdeI (YjbR/CyaY-like superfamily)
LSEPVEFAAPAEMRAWLARHHATEPELWVRLWKQGTGKPSITWQDGVREALCWGWIDAVKRSEGPDSWLQRFTPRRARSKWSRRNRDLAQALAASGLMQAPGLAEMRAAQADGRWQAAYAGPATMEIPEDFMAALRAGPPEALAHFKGLDRRNLFAIHYRVTTPKKPETRARKIAEIVAMLARGEVFH